MKFRIVLIAVLFLFCVCTIAFAEGEQEITLTTYYPAPYGEYNVASADILNCGDMTAGHIDVNDGTAANGQHGRSITIQAQGGGTGITNGGDIILSPGAASGTGNPGNISASSRRITNVADPVNNGDALTKGYLANIPGISVRSGTFTMLAGSIDDGWKYYTEGTDLATIDHAIVVKTGDAGHNHQTSPCTKITFTIDNSSDEAKITVGAKNKGHNCTSNINCHWIAFGR